MFELKEIKKHYNLGGNITKALDGISVSFRKEEFIAILGASGSGKTTCLNIIGGLDIYDSGDMIINGKSTKGFKEEDWDAYRNNSIGFVFQSYNLISHLGIIENVELGMTLSGISKQEKRKNALEVLDQVGLKEHMHKKPNQLSGGQMQRVAIARALANNPDILLCDEPTGALDTETSVQIMQLIKAVSKEKLVIMVTHNPNLAKEYADRIVEFKDGHIITDSHPYIEKPKEDVFKLKKTSMSYLTALRLSFNNIKTKKGRTALTAFASSIGIIGIALILSLSGGFQEQIDKYQTDSLANFPIMITQTVASMDRDVMMKQSKKVREKMQGTYVSDEDYPDTKMIYPYDSSENVIIHNNKFTDEYMEYIENTDSSIISSIGYTRTVGLNLMMKKDGEISPINASSIAFSSYPQNIGTEGEENVTYLEENYDLLAGEFPTDKEELVLVVSDKNTVDKTILKTLGLDAKKQEIPFDEIIGITLKSVKNNDYYVKSQAGLYSINVDFEAAYKSKDSMQLKITGIIRQKEKVYFAVLSEGIAYSDELAIDFIENAKNSDIVTAQKSADFNILSGQAFIEQVKSPVSMGSNSNPSTSMMDMMTAAGGTNQSITKDNMLSLLGAVASPYMISIYPLDFESKELVTEYLNAWNTDKDENIYYTDLATTMTELSGGIMNAITLVLIAFAGISLVVSLIMISIITYTSVLERTKEIGILKALGARKKDITRVFDAETVILGVFSGCLGVTLAYLCTFPINNFIYAKTALENVAQLKPTYAISLILVSTVLTVLGGHVPAKMAAKKDAVEALRSE